MTRKSEVTTFLKISVCLTGFTEIELESTGMLEPYFEVLMNQNSLAVADAFLEQAAEIMNKYKDDPAELENEIRNNLMPDSKFNGITKNIIRMWYLGNWGNMVVSPKAYTQGLIWGVAGTHPPGAKQPGYASWAIAPIEQATINKKTQKKYEKQSL